MTVLTYECTHCAASAVTAQSGLPEGWEDRGDALLCGDCILSVYSKTPGETGPDDDGDPDLDRAGWANIPSGLDRINRPEIERFFAVTRPNSNCVTLFFTRGTVDLFLNESMAIEAALAGANLIARGQHPVQLEGAK